MDEYISRDEAINAIKNLESNMPAKDNYAKGYDAALGRALIAVREVPPAADVQPVKQWVKLHDKHPDTEGSYLVCDQYGECEVAEYLPDIKSWFTHKVNGEIRYWMPLPEPPKDGDTNE